MTDATTTPHSKWWYINKISEYDPELATSSSLWNKRVGDIRKIWKELKDKYNDNRTIETSNG